MTHLSPKQAAIALGVSESSVKRWCDLGTVPVVRTAGGHRRIPRQSLEQLLARGGDFADLTNMVDFGARSAVLPRSTASDAGPNSCQLMSLEERRSEFLDALRLGHENRCGQLIHGLIDTGCSRSAAADLLITNAMHQFGHMWEQGDLAIYQERRACGICLGLLHDLKQQAVPRANGPVAIGGTLSNDTYQLPSQLVELTLCDLGWRATSLGCNLPMHSFKAAVVEYRPKLLWFSLSIVHSEEDFVREFNELADSICDSTAIIIGGRAANDSLRPRLRYTAHCDSLTHLAELAEKLVDR